MSGKKDPNRYTIRFQESEPSHKLVMDILNEQGRHKAKYIVAAVLHYNNCTSADAGTTIDDQIRGYIRALVNEAAHRREPDATTPPDSHSSSACVQYFPAGNQSSPHSLKKNRVHGISDDDIGGIMSAVAGFRKK